MSNPPCLNRHLFLIMNNKIKNAVVKLGTIDDQPRTLFVSYVPFDLYELSGNIPHSTFGVQCSAFGVSQSLNPRHATHYAPTTNPIPNTTEHK
jgi:hypothetical protein